MNEDLMVEAIQLAKKFCAEYIQNNDVAPTIDAVKANIPMEFHEMVLDIFKKGVFITLKELSIEPYALCCHIDEPLRLYNNDAILSHGEWHRKFDSLTLLKDFLFNKGPHIEALWRHGEYVAYEFIDGRCVKHEIRKVRYVNNNTQEIPYYFEFTLADGRKIRTQDDDDDHHDFNNISYSIFGAFQAWYGRYNPYTKYYWDIS